MTVHPMIWRYWCGPAPRPMCSPVAAGLIDRLSPGRLCDLTDDDVPPTLRLELDAAAGAVTLVSHQQATHRANLLRWWLLAEHGGVWLDHDVLPLVDVLELERPWCAAVGGELVSCAMGFAAGDPLPLRMFAAGIGAELGDRPAGHVSGDAVLNGYTRARIDDRPARITLELPRLLRVPLPVDSDGVPTDAPPPWAIVHLWNHREATCDR